MTAVDFKQGLEDKRNARMETPAVPVELPEAGRMLNVVLGMLLLIMLSSVVMHYL